MVSKIDKTNLGYLGSDYQVRLIAQLLRDIKFSRNIIDIINPNYFKDEYHRLIVSEIKNAKETNDVIPNISTIKFRLLNSVSDEYTRKLLSKELEKIEQADSHDFKWVQETAMKFCKKQELKKALKDIDKIIDKDDDETYHECESILKKALEHGNGKDEGVDVFYDLESVLSDDYREPIRTGISGLDEIMDGGLGKGELALILAPFGVGKTSMITKIANTAWLDGKNVLQIFFEDTIKNIQRKHLSCITGFELNSLNIRREEVLKKRDEILSRSNVGKLKLKKFPSDGITIPNIKNYVYKLISDGFTPDIILLDYIDVVVPSKKFDDANVGEGSVMRQFESMLAELDIPGWTASQGNRESIKAAIVESNQMGGSIKKGQIVHFLCSIAKTMDQKDNGTATMAVLKSRFGKSGVVFEDITFNNATIQVDMDKNSAPKSQVQYLEDTQTAKVSRVAELMNRKKALNEE